MSDSLFYRPCLRPIQRRRKQGRHATDGDDAVLALKELGPTASMAVVKDTTHPNPSSIPGPSKTAVFR